METTGCNAAGRITESGDSRVTSEAMKRVNPKITWREWLIAPAYQPAEQVTPA